MITGMARGYPQATTISREQCQGFLPAPSSPQQKQHYSYYTMKAIINAPIPVGLESASTHPSADQPRRRAFRSARQAQLTTRTCRQSRPRGDSHRSTLTTQEHLTCSAPLEQPARPTVLHLPSQQASHHHPPLLS